MRLYLIGFMGAGKSTVGRALARELGYRVMDLDAEIERHSGRSIAELFEQRGEKGFRRVESQVLARTLQCDDLVVATGGGCFTWERNRRLIRQGGMSVWLDVPYDRILERMSEHGRRRRPLLQDSERAEGLYRQRLPSYAAADHRLRLTGGEDPEAVAARIAALVRGEACAT